MKLKEMLLAIGLSGISLSIYAADQVVKEETTPPAPEGAITVQQIPPIYTPPPSAQVSKPEAPSEINQPVGPSNTPSIPVQQPVMQQPAAQQPATQQPGTQTQPGMNASEQAPKAMQGTLPQNPMNTNTLPAQPTTGAPLAPQNPAPGQQPMTQPNGQQPSMQQNGQPQ